MGEKDREAESPRATVIRLAKALLQHYDVAEPPVPVEQMLQEPPAGLDGVDPSQISTIVEHGLYSYEPRLAMARLLYRVIARSMTAKETLGVDVSLSVSYADVKSFARYLLMPALWIRRLAELDLSVDEMSAYLQVPSYAVVTRLAELGLPVPDTE